MAGELNTYKGSMLVVFEGHDMACASKQMRDLNEAAKNLGFTVADQAWGVISSKDSGPRPGGTLSPSVPAPDSGIGQASRVAGSVPEVLA